MNFSAVLKGYFRAMGLFLFGSLLLGSICWLFQKEEMDIGMLVGYLILLCLIIGGISAGVQARRRGYIHGSMVGLCCFITKFLVLCGIIPEIFFAQTIMYSAIKYIFWGAVGGLCGINLAVLREQNNIRLHKRSF